MPPLTLRMVVVASLVIVGWAFYVQYLAYRVGP